MNDRVSELIAAIDARKARVGVVGMGYVGLPLAVEFAQSGFQVLGFEANPEKVKELNAGRSYVGDVPSEQLATVVESGHLVATPATGCDATPCASGDAFFIW